MVFALGAMLTSGGAAWAGGVTVKIGQQQGGGDPPYDYIISAFLDPGYEVASSGYFTIGGTAGLLGVTPANFPNNGDLQSTTSEPDSPPAVIWTPSITSPINTSSPYSADVTWTFYGNSTITNPTGSGQEVYLGQFLVETTQSFNNPPYNPGSPISYYFQIFTTDGAPVSGGGIALMAPEPSSALLLLGGIGMLPLVVLAKKRRRRG
jgi:hypothetical protein